MLSKGPLEMPKKLMSQVRQVTTIGSPDTHEPLHHPYVHGPGGFHPAYHAIAYGAATDEQILAAVEAQYAQTRSVFGLPPSLNRVKGVIGV